METDVKIDANEIIARLVRLQAGIDYVREHIEDVTITEDDLLSIKEAKEDLRKGKTRRL